MMRKVIGFCLLSFFIIISFTVYPKNNLHRYVSIIIDDAGENWQTGINTLQLPGKVTIAFLPFALHTKELAERAYQMKKEVMLHAPMEALKPHDLGKGALTENMPEKEVQNTLLMDLNQVPHAQGINNHMGSLLTQDPIVMWQIMQTLKPYHLYYVDSRTTEKSVAEKIAYKNNVPVTHRDIFLDNKVDTQNIHHQFLKLIQLSFIKGHAIAIGHPHPKTLLYLSRAIPELEKMGIELIPVSKMIQITSRS